MHPVLLFQKPNIHALHDFAVHSPDPENGYRQTPLFFSEALLVHMRFSFPLLLSCYVDNLCGDLSQYCVFQCHLVGYGAPGIDMLLKLSILEVVQVMYHLLFLFNLILCICQALSPTGCLVLRLHINCIPL